MEVVANELGVVPSQLSLGLSTASSVGVLAAVLDATAPGAVLCETLAAGLGLLCVAVVVLVLVLVDVLVHGVRVVVVLDVVRHVDDDLAPVGS